jgi:hypothetical protein
MRVDQEYQVANMGNGNMGSGATGLIAMVVLFVVVFFLLFKDRDGDRGNNHYNPYPPVMPLYNPYSQSRECGTCVKDESNWEEDRHLSDVACNNTEKILASQTHIAERAADREFIVTQNLLTQKDNIIQSLQLKSDFDNKLAGIMGAIGVTNNHIDKEFCKTDALIERDYWKLNTHLDKIECELPHRPPVYARTDTVCLEQIPDRRERTRNEYCCG